MANFGLSLRGIGDGLDDVSFSLLDGCRFMGVKFSGLLRFFGFMGIKFPWLSLGGNGDGLDNDFG